MGQGASPLRGFGGSTPKVFTPFQPHKGEKMNLPNQLTILRILLIPFFLIALLGGLFAPPNDRYVAVAIFVFASATDALDGYIARSRNLITTFGKFMDPLADKMLVAAALIAMVELSMLPSWVVILIICREFIITGFRTIAAGNNIIIAAGNLGKIKTVTQMVMIVFVLLGFTHPVAVTIGTVLIWLSVIFTVISAVEYIYKNIKVLKG